VLVNSIRQFVRVIYKSLPIIFLYLINLTICALIARAIFYGES
jgi:hypothetical protein